MNTFVVLNGHVALDGVKLQMEVVLQFSHLHHEFVTLDIIINGEKSKGF